jgi:hypothetical protein
MEFKLRDFFLSEELLKEEGELNYEATYGGEKFRVVVDVNKNPTKKGIKVKFFPVNEQGMVLTNLTPEEIGTLQNSIATTISPKFAEYNLEFDRDTDAPDRQAANFQIPLDSVFTFIRDTVLGGGEESSAETSPTPETNFDEMGYDEEENA